MTRKKLPLPRFLVTCDMEWEHMAELEGKKAASDWMKEHAAGLGEFKGCRWYEFRVWEMIGNAKVVVQSDVRVDLMGVLTQDDD